MIISVGTRVKIKLLLSSHHRHNNAFCYNFTRNNENQKQKINDVNEKANMLHASYLPDNNQT